MGETVQGTGGFVTELPLVTDMPTTGCCGGTTMQDNQSTQVSACCGEPVAVMEPEETGPAAPDAGCCAPAGSADARQEPSSCCG
ncbi:MAG TPA: hypothetical protein VFQ44_00160 [Streptosporangiaceae bacterium]|nr:hypothetical protein [Streptosporangiaceae bacterium]